ncbi:hypothetical protein EI94DRAFT_1794037 [Lactarius quietus]|nr:hypothetical protein EI94DRAFT_1794037 [Lactarius quietus]
MTRPNNNGFINQVDDHNSDSDGDWNDNEQDLQITIKNPQGLPKLWLTSWLSGEVDMSPSTPLSIRTNMENTDTSAQLSDRASVISTPRPTTSTLPLAVAAMMEANTPAGNVSLPAPTDTPTKCEVSPKSGLPNLCVDTNLVFLEGLKKLMLTHQHLIIRAIVQEAIDNLQVSLLIWNAFPDPIVAWAFTKDALFSYMFPVHFNNNGQPTHEVPVPMVALVATVLYATLYEWHTGEQQNHEFLVNAYMDITFHIMMSDIYVRVSTTPGAPSAAAPIANLDLNMLEA